MPKSTGPTTVSGCSNCLSSGWCKGSVDLRQCNCTYSTGDYPYLKIVEAANRNGCDLILMATHGRRGISRLLLGSETSKVLALATVPVLVCR